jgi:hypothetical protein
MIKKPRRNLMVKKTSILVILCLLLLTACSIVNPPAGSTLTAELETAAPNASEIDWSDYSIFEAGLISSEEYILSDLTSASVYHINIEIADDMLSLMGLEEVKYTNQEDQPLTEIYFQLFPNMEGGQSTILSAAVDGTEAPFAYEDSSASVRVGLPEPLNTGESTVIQLEFEVKLPQDAGGNYGLFGFIDNIMVLDGFYPAIPVYDEDGWHFGWLPPNSDTTFQDASFYVVTITAPKKLVIVTSGVEIAKEEAGGLQVTTFVLGPARDFYIAASDEFEVVSRTIGETTVNSYTVDGLEDGSEIAATTAKNAIEAFNTYYGIYPYSQFNVVSTPMQGAYGIEYPGIVGINYALYDSSDPTNASILESTVAHEVGHQWLYNIVGDDQINEPWLDESMTQYATGLYYLNEYGEAGYGAYTNSWYNRWDRVNREEMPIGLPAGEYEGREYSGIVYGRGPIFIQTLAETMGEVKFQAFLKDYYESFKWGIATTPEFKALAEKHCECDLTELFTAWVY